MQNREAMFLPEIEELFKRSLEGYPDIDHGDVWAWVGANLVDPAVGVFVARVEGVWCGLAVATVRTDVWSSDPTVLYLYAGARGVFAALMDQVRTFCDPHSGRFRFVNGTKHSEKAYLRLLHPWASGSKAGAVIACEWKESKP